MRVSERASKLFWAPPPHHASNLRSSESVITLLSSHFHLDCALKEGDRRGKKRVFGKCCSFFFGTRGQEEEEGGRLGDLRVRFSGLSTDDGFVVARRPREGE